MTDLAPAVALLFDDIELGGHLRDALSERGARIVHEGEVSSLSRELLQSVGIDVLVINLDDSADNALDHLYALIEGDRPRLVFNDAQASRALLGWDRARWARHLAAKVLAIADVDPPRPEAARVGELPPAPPTPMQASTPKPDEPDEPVAVSADSDVGPVLAEVPQEPVPVSAPVAEPEPEPEMVSDSDSDFPVYDADDGRHEQDAAAESESLASELEALLASGELQMDNEDATGPGLRYLDEDELPPLHDGDFGALLTSPDPEQLPDSMDQQYSSPDASSETLSGVTPPVFQLDHLQLSTMTDPSITTIPAAAAEPVILATPASVRAPDGWALLDDEAPSAASDATEQPDATAFGVAKMSAADFLAPDVEPSAHEFEAKMSLELVSMEEAIAPQAYVHEHEMVLDELGSALSRVVLLGASVDGVDSVCAFLGALPSTARLTFLHTQHLGQKSDVALVERFAAHCALPVQLARQGSRANGGEVLVVPAGQQVRLRRDGSVELQSIDQDATGDPSIDTSLTMAANAFGRDALAIVFAGRGNDAVAGAQAIHDRGGQVWVESSSGEHFADMVSGIFAERLVSFSGTPPELAAHLIEVFS
jgi:chemosensory pili system protein ChpB (putative protein-glutamate methylesterase)